MSRRPLSARARRLAIGIARDMDAAESGFVKQLQQPIPMTYVADDVPVEPEPIPGFATRQEQELGNVVWHCSDEGSGPDVGISVGLGGKTLWVGEITHQRWDELDAEQKAQLGGTSFGWFLMLYPDCVPLAAFADSESARAFAEDIAAAIQTAKGEKA